MTELNIAPWGAVSEDRETLKVRRRGDVTVLEVGSDCDGPLMRQLAPVVRNAAAWGADVVIDLAFAELVDDEAIGMLGEVAAEVQRRDGRWVVVAMDGAGDDKRLAMLASLTMKLTTCTDVDEAMALLRSPLPATPGTVEFDESAPGR
jgi:anti-anti-sigma regulatory factor